MNEQQMAGHGGDSATNTAAQAPGVSRRGLLKSALALGAGSVLPGCFGDDSDGASGRPNILFILVDEMRFPKVFPQGVADAAQFLAKFMPNTYRLWQSGVKFGNHNSAATACSPSRGVLVTGLYSHQTWFGTTLVVIPGQTTADSPPLQPGFPTYGKLLREAGYRTPYIGKWHCSTSGGPTQDLSAYGFDGMTYPDPIANNLQGTYGDMTNPSYYYYNDAYIAGQASAWLAQRRVAELPWCLTVGFQNPHDQEFFPGGTEFQTYTELFASATNNPQGYAQKQNWTPVPCAAAVPWSSNQLLSPPSNGYPVLAPNWQSAQVLQATKPAAQILNRQFSEAEFGGLSESPTTATFNVSAYPFPATAYSGYVVPDNVGIGHAPFNYWQKAFDLYTYLLTVLDQSIGQVLDAIPADVASNTVIVFTSDHGDYVGAHGFVAGKTLSLYDEAIRVPLIVSDPTGRFTGDVDTVRPQLTSSADIMPMLVGFAWDGKTTWMQGDYQTLYGQRYDMFPLLKSATLPGLDYALFASDEVVASGFDFATAPDVDGQRTPVHIVGLVTPEYKLGVYSRWPAGTTRPSVNAQQYEFYDYATVGGRQETDNTYATAPGFEAIKDRLLDDLVPNVLEAPLPSAYWDAQLTAKAELIAFNLLDQSSGRE